MTPQIHRRLMQMLGVALTAATLLCGTSLAVADELDSREMGVTAGAASTVADVTTGSTQTVSTEDELVAAIHNANISNIQLTKTITLRSTDSASGAVLPVYFDTPKTITATEGSTLYFHGPMELGADVTFKDMSVIFNSSGALNSKAQREIFLNGHSLTLDNVNTWLECNDGLGTFGCASGQTGAIIPSVYGGSSTYSQGQGKTQGSHAQLVVRNARTGSADSTALQVVDMSKGESDATGYNGKASVTLDARTTVTDGISTAGTSESTVTLNASAISSSSKLGSLTGGANSTLTLDKGNQNNPGFYTKSNGFTNTVLNGVTLMPQAGSTFTNLTLPAGSLIDLSNTGDSNKYLTKITVDGDLVGGGTMRVSYTVSTITVNGQVSGTTLVTPPNSTLFQGHGYITAPNASSTSFSTGDSSTSWAKWTDGVWMVANVDSWTTRPTIEGWTENVDTPKEPQGAAKYGTVTYTYKTKGADDTTFSITKPTAAGNYVMRAEVKESKVSEGVYTAGLEPVDVEFTIAADPTPKPAITSATTLLDGKETSNFTYGETITVQVDTKNIADNATITLASADGTELAESAVTGNKATLTLDTGDKALTVGTHQLRVQQNGVDQTRVNLAALTIKARKLTPTLSGTASKEYDRTTAISAEQGANLTLSVQDGDILDADAEAIALTGDFAFDSANASGSVQVHASNLTITSKTRGVAAASFYTLTTTRVSANVGTITPKTVHIQWANTDNRAEGDGLGAVTATLVGLVGNDEVTAVVEDGEANAAGKHTARVIGLVGAQAGNYALPADGTGTTVTFSVANRAVATTETTVTDDGVADAFMAASEPVTSETGAAVTIVAVVMAVLVLIGVVIVVAAALKR